MMESHLHGKKRKFRADLFMPTSLIDRSMELLIKGATQQLDRTISVDLSTSVEQVAGVKIYSDVLHGRSPSEVGPGRSSQR